MKEENYAKQAIHKRRNKGKISELVKTFSLSDN